MDNLILYIAAAAAGAAAAGAAAAMETPAPGGLGKTGKPGRA